MTTLQQTTPPTLHDPAALAVRNAMLALLRAWEEMYNLPRSIPTKYDRGEVVKPRDREHHNR